MILFKRGGWDAVYVGAALAVVVTILYFYREEIADDFFHQFPPSVFGFSSRDQVQFQCSIACTKVFSRGLVHKLVKSFSDNDLETLDLHVGFTDMQILLEDQQTAITKDRLIDPREVRGDIMYQGESYPVKIRLKGELKDHWSEPGRMSLKVSVRKGRTIMGFSTFSLHKPASRQHPYEPAFEDFARAAGGIAVRHKYAKLSLNGEYWGVWNVEERVSGELLEKQQRKDSLVFDLGLDHFWRYVRTSTNPYTNPSYRLKDVHLFGNVYAEKRIRKNPDLREQYSYVLQQLMIDGGDKVYDSPAMARSVLLAYVWGTNHVLLGGNTRYYLNPYTLKLEPITSDQSWPKAVEKFGLTYPYPMPYRRFVETDAFRELYQDTLRTVLEIEPQLNQFFWDYFSLFPNDFHRPLNVVSENMRRAEKSGFQDILFLHRKVLPTDRFVYIQDPSAANELSRPVREDLQYHIHARHFTDGTVRVRNLLDIPIVLEEVRASDDVLWEGLPEIPPKGEIDLDTPFDGIRDNEIQVTTRLDELKRVHEAGLSVTPLEFLNNPLLDDTDPTGKYEFILGGKNGYRITRGQWRIDYPLVINGSLEILAGTTLSFAPDAYLIVNGYLDALGESTAPIRFRGIGGRWKGIYVYSAERPSNWKHVEISDIAEIQDGPLFLSGGVNFYKADLRAEHVTIRNASGEDALNIVHSDVDLDRLTVSGAHSDAIDMDFCTGVVRNLTIRNSRGDGLDLSGSRIDIENMSVTEVTDKALSVGEASEVSLHGANLNTIGVGIASKDGSSVYAEDVNISNVTLYPAMSYRKKDFYDPPDLELVRVAFAKDSVLLRQVGSGLRLDGIAIRESELDVDALYRGDVMAK